MDQGAMRKLTKNFRSRAAMFVAVAYAFCVLAPTTAVAFADSPTAFHCLAEVSEMGMPSGHEDVAQAHANGAVHHDGVADNRTDADGKTHSCCGLFCVSAIAHNPELTFGMSAPASPASPAVANELAGRAPSPLHRPPIV